MSEMPAVDNATFMRNVREAIANGYDRCCSRCGVGVYDESDIHESDCPEWDPSHEIAVKFELPA